VDGAAHLVAEHFVDELVLLEAGEAGEAVGDDLGAKVVAAAGQVLDRHVGAGQRRLDALFQFLGAWHVTIQGTEGNADTIGEPMVMMTDIAAEKVRDFMTAQSAAGDVGLRVGVRGGGCSGFQYALALDERRDDDHVFETSGIPVLVDPASLQYVDGSTVDFTESFQGSGFEVSNPNVVASCGCGSSFRIADEEPSCGTSV
jgi:iron-sulfur cluster assembly protein